jgi:hypothetical protein
MKIFISTGIYKQSNQICKYSNNRYILEHLNIIQLGNKIGTVTTRQYYKDILIKKTSIIITEIPNSFIENKKFHNAIFDAIVSKLFPLVSSNE